MAMRIFGIPQAKDKCYATAVALSYWAFRCRDRSKSPAMGTKTWTYLESSIQNSAQVSTCLEDYLQNLCNKLISHLRPAELTYILQPEQVIYRVNKDGSEIQQRDQDQDLVFMGWGDLLEAIAPDGFSEWDVLELCRTRASIIQVLCRLRFEEDRALGKADVEDWVEVEVGNV
jgi:hypothetical protein